MTKSGEKSAPERNPLAVAIGERIGAAMEDARIRSVADLSRRTGIHERSLRRYLKGEKVPQVDALMGVSQACHVSIDWLVFGRSEPTSAYAEWAETASGKEASPEAHAFLLRLPLFGYVPTPRFYEFAHIAWRDGLSAADVAQAARDTDRVDRR